MKHLYTRAFALLLFACAAPAALAQGTTPYIDKDDATTYEEAALRPESAPPPPAEALDYIDRLKLAAAQNKNADGSFGNIDAETVAALEEGGVTFINESAIAAADSLQALADAAEEALAPEASGGRKNDGLDFYRRNVATAPVQRYPVIPDGYGRDGDGFPDRMAISGTIVGAGSLRICRFDAPPVSRWLRIRLSDTTAAYPGEQIVVAVQCHEDKKELLVGRRVRMEVWKSIVGRPIRMATDDVPNVGTPMYESYPGNVRLGG